MDAPTDDRNPSWFHALNQAARSLFAALYPCRFALFAVAIPGIALATVPQLAECIRALAERAQIPELRTLQWVAVFLGALAWAACAWYWTRQLLNFRFAPQRDDRVFRAAQALLPRLIGSVALLLLALAIHRAGRGYDFLDRGGFARSLDTYAWLAAGLAVAFYLFVQFRRRIFGLAPVAMVARARDLPRQTLIVLAVSVAVTLAFFLAFWLVPLSIAPRVGVVAILLIAAAAWCTAGSVAVFLDGRYGVPVLPIAVVACVVFSLWNDNHVLRGSAAVAGERPKLSSYAHDWLEARHESTSASAPYPVVIVATAGGGIRAAYWTGSLLAALEDRYGAAFGEHTFAISGVSGGSLGAATYVALLADRLTSGKSASCAGDPSNSLQACASAVLSQDFLAPVVGSMLFPDLVQRFLPVPIANFDRGAVLEQSWERAWTDQGLPDSLSAPFYGLWSRPAARLHAPLLFLNSTRVESGQRVVVSPVVLPPENEFAGGDELATLTAADPPLSSAAHLSARFTYVSPAASIIGRDGKLVAHLVDGGYFENTGADTAASIASAIRAEATSLSANIEIYVLLISNNPGDLAASEAALAPERWLTELRAPVAALLNARDARGREAASAIGQLATHGAHALAIGLDRSGVTLPLGWTLSDAAQCEIDRQLASALAAPRAPGTVATLDALLPVVSPLARVAPGCQ